MTLNFSNQGNAYSESANLGIGGHVKLWRTPKTFAQGVASSEQVEILVDQPNLILYGGMDLLAKALVGEPNAKIWGMYVGYQNTASSNDVVKSVIDRQYSVPFESYGTPGALSTYGYLRVPLSIPPTYMASANYTGNIPIFTISISSVTTAGGVGFADDSKIFEVALVSMSSGGEYSVFARTNFNPFKYDASFNLGCSWGIRFLAN